jgi:hypothetical protein
MRLCRMLACCLFFLATAALHAESKNPADYPLRVHVFGRSETNFYHFRAVEESKGEGRANLFANGDVHGIDFTFDCSQKLRNSFGYETYPARWKKPGQELVVLMPVFGKANAYWTCDFKTDVKDFAYLAHDGRIGSEPSAQFKAWMIKHDYDPEHGKNTPIRPEPPATSSTPAPTPAPDPAP